MVYTTHHLEEVEPLCDRLALLDRGRLVAEGTPEELGKEATCGHMDPAPFGAAVTFREVGRPRLERVFMELTARSPGAS
jgi:ABC-type multidrug transport system ATPase subunit